MALSESAKARRRPDFPGLGSKGADGPGRLGLGIRLHLSSGRAFPAAGCAPPSARLRRGGGQYNANLRAAFCRSAHLGVSRGAARLGIVLGLFILISGGARVFLVSSSEIALQTFYQGVLMSGVAIMTFNRAVAMLAPPRRRRSWRLFPCQLPCWPSLFSAQSRPLRNG
jgi:hypothetical protein